MKKLVEVFLLDLINSGYSIRWVQGIETFRDGKEVILMYNTQDMEELGVIELTEDNAKDLEEFNSVGDLVRYVKYPLLDPEVLEKHIKGMVKVDPTYQKYVDLIEEVDQTIDRINKKYGFDVALPEEPEDYEGQAQRIAEELKVSLVVGDPVYKKHFLNDTQLRYVFPCKLKRGRKSYSFKFGQSIASGCKAPTLYGVLTCLQKYNPGEDLEEFCANFGYDSYEKETKKVYKAVVKEFQAMQRLFSEEELDRLAEVE